MFGFFKVPWNMIESELEARIGDVFDKFFDSIEDSQAELNQLKEKHPNLNETALANEIINEVSKKTALIGGGAALPDLVPGAGWSVMIASLVGDYCFSLREYMSMFMKFSYLFDPECELRQRKKDVISLLIFLARDKKNNAFAKDVLDDIKKLHVDVMARKVLIRSGVQLGLKFFRKKLFALLPGIGIALSGGVNYLGARSAGRLGIEYFQDKAEFLRVHGQASSNLEVTQRAAVQMMINLSKMDETVSEESKSKIDEMMDVFGYSDEEKAAVHKDFDKREITPIAIKDIRLLTEDDKKYVLKQGLKMLGDKLTSKQQNYLEFITRAFGLTPADMNKIKNEVSAERGSV